MIRSSAVLPPADLRPAQRTWRAFRANPLGMGSAAVILLMIIVAIIAPWLAEFPGGYGTEAHGHLGVAHAHPREPAIQVSPVPEPSG